MAAIADEAGEAALARDCRERLRKLMKKRTKSSIEVAVGIRTARLLRLREDDATRKRVAEEDAEAKHQKTLLKLAEEKRKTANAEARRSGHAVKMAEPLRKTHALTLAARRQRRTSDNIDVARCYAAEVSDKLRRLNPGEKKAMFAAAGRRSVSVAKGTWPCQGTFPNVGRPGSRRRNCESLLPPSRRLRVKYGLPRPSWAPCTRAVARKTLFQSMHSRRGGWPSS